MSMVAVGGHEDTESESEDREQSAEIGRFRFAKFVSHVIRRVSHRNLDYR